MGFVCPFLFLFNVFFFKDWLEVVVMDLWGVVLVLNLL